MFGKLFGKDNKPSKPKAPEVMGLYLGGSFELDSLKLSLLEPELVIEAAARSQLIQAVGHAPLDSGGDLLRFYTDDDAFLQVVLDGGMSENHITDVKLWHFYETKTIGSDSQWQDCLNNIISQPTYSLEGHTYTRVWEAVGDVSPPVAVTETTYEEDGDVSTTDQFIMLYERPLDNDRTESLLVVGEEKVVGNNLDRCLVISTGFDIQPADIQING
ncbi:YjfK family protein [Alteromonas pelagimontana]|uniref:YjfK family protein n=1 Tax=Alteromonas pelagimontana TaxID=1858656 RepID=A0A6M4MFR4_9ALTE|nr:YjfK family protein [Alteromonas pelagimontana]QJR82011.1 YjfK family protein [Alteromonas pelagimontana]